MEIKKEDLIDYLAQFVVYNAWLGDKKDFNKVIKNAEQYLVDCEFEEERKVKE